MFKKPFIPVKVYKWNSATSKEEYIFDSDNVTQNTININIYQDFNVTDAVHRIGLYLLSELKQNTEPFYAWVDSKPLCFSIKNIRWDGYNVNPFKSNEHKSPQLNEPISYEYQTNELFAYNKINIVFASDLPNDLRKNKYYFSDIKMLTYKQYKKHDDKLIYLQNVRDQNVKILGEYFSRLNFAIKLKNIVIAELFDMLHTSKHIDMIQWIDDPSRVLYKLSKKHRIKKEWFNMWINIDKIPKTNVLNMYSIINKYGYCKISIDNEGMLLVNYVFDVRSFTKMTDINQHKQIIHKILESNLKQRIQFKELSLNSTVRIEVHNSSFKTLIKKISEYIDIFHFIKSDINKNKVTITCTYKRSSNYAQNTDIYDYIRSRIAIGISKQEIIEELQNLGITGNIDDMVNIEIQQQQPSNANINIQNNGTIVLIEPYSQGYNVSIVNCPNLKEMEYMMYWLSKIIATSISAKPIINTGPVAVVANIPNKSPSVSSSSSSVSKGSIDWDIDRLGGAGKAKYLIDMLQEADKELFGENYARDKCQNPEQPIVLSEQQMTALQNNNQAHFDNFIKYGSNPNIQNYYACPRLWCPESKVPLSVDVHDAKCPIENEKPVEMFWNKDKNKKRYVKLIKPNEKGMCVPCCKKKEPKLEENNKCQLFLKTNKDTVPVIQSSEPKQNIPDNDEYYVMNQVAPIPVGRYGTIPEYLHSLLFWGKDVRTEMCNKTIQKSQPCFVRLGIKNNRYDSIVLAISSLLGFNTKHAFMKDIKSKLDILTFISLDDGNICKQFMSMEDLSTKFSNKLLKSYQKFTKQYPELIAFNNNATNTSRILNIYYAYKRFIEYIQADNFHIEKVPEFLYSMIMIIYNVTILLWDKTEKDLIYLNCPQQAYVNLDLNPDISMLMKEGKYYEPIILKSRGIKENVTVFKLNEHPKLKELLANCQNNYNFKIFKNLYSLNNWVKSNILQNSTKFTIKKVILNNDLTINKVMTSGNILLTFEKLSISLLPLLLNELGLSKQNVVFYDDICDKQYNISLRKSDISLFADKCKTFDINFNAGILKQNGDIGNEYYSVITLAKDILSNNMIIHSKNMANEYYKFMQAIGKHSNIWFDMHKMIVNKIIKNYSDDKFEELKSMNRESRVNTLMNLFNDDKLPHKKKLRIILEEIPIENKSSLKNWLSNIIISTKYDFLSNSVKEDNDQFIFSQNAFISNGIKHIPSNILTYHKALPYMHHINQNIQDVNIELNTIPRSAVTNDIPDMLKGSMQKLTSKWVQHKKSKWFNMVYIKTDYTKELVINLVDWLAKSLQIKITFDDILMTTRQNYFDVLNDKDAMIELLQDTSYFNNWLAVVNKKYPTVQTFWDNVYTDLSIEQRRVYCTKILDSGKLYPNNLHFKAISKLLNVSILILHRGKYGKFDVTQNARGGIMDLILSSTLYPASNNMQSRPLLIFNKLNEKQYSGYYLIVDKDKNNIYMKYADVPNNIKILVDAHMSNN